MAFFTQFIDAIDFETFADFVESFYAMEQLVLENTVCRQLTSLLYQLRANVNAIEHFVVLYGHQLVWSSFDSDGTRWLYQYFVRYLGGDWLWGESPHSSTPNGFMFETPPTFFFKSNGGSTEAFTCPVFKSAELTVLLGTRSSEDKVLHDPSVLGLIEKTLKTECTPLLHQIRDSLSKTVDKNATASKTQYICYDRMAVAIQTGGVSSLKTFELTREVQGCLNDVRQRLQQGSDEFFVKTNSDYWISGKRSNGRELYTIQTKRDATLAEADEEVRRLCNTVFSDVFI
jgi:hypothetical protein